jgi:hypothetical protein
MFLPLQAGPPWSLRKEEPIGLRRKFLQLEKNLPALSRTLELALPMNMDAIVRTPVQVPDIDWNPSFTKYEDRVSRLSELHDSLPTSLPKDFPKAVSAPWVWDGSDFTNEQYVFTLHELEVEEIEKALADFKGIFPIFMNDTFNSLIELRARAWTTAR